MTEDDHKKLWCPHARMMVEDRGRMSNGFNRSATTKEIDCNPRGIRCIGSNCAMWRWADAPSCIIIKPRSAQDVFDRYTEDDPEPRRPDYVPDSYEWSPCVEDPACWIEPVEEALQRCNGFCGLAGEPNIVL